MCNEVASVARKTFGHPIVVHVDGYDISYERNKGRMLPFLSGELDDSSMSYDSLTVADNSVCAVTVSS